jgi:hypothetical protein
MRGGRVAFGAKGLLSLKTSDGVVVMGSNASSCSKREVEGTGTWAGVDEEGHSVTSVICELQDKMKTSVPYMVRR